MIFFHEDLVKPLTMKTRSGVIPHRRLETLQVFAGGLSLALPTEFEARE
jgi:hypothetical protein